MRKSIKNYTTEMSVEKSIMEIQAILAAHGAEKIMYDYDQGKPVGVSFLVTGPHGPMPVKLPARIENVRKVMEDNYGSLGRNRNEYLKNTDKIAWRNIKDWVDAQMALIEIEMVTMPEVFLPFIVLGEQTVYERFETGQLQLGPGEK